MAEAFGIAVAENAAGTVSGNWILRILKGISNPIILVFKWKANVENLKKKVAELKEEVQSVEHYTQAVERRGEEIEQKLKTWLTKTSKFIEAAHTIEGDEEKAKKKCLFGLCINPVSRYKLSKQAVEDSKVIADLVQRACGFNLPLSYLPIPQQEVAAPVKGFQEFDSRMKVLDQIMEALKSPSINIMGVHGMPGVGKTMLLKEVKRKAEQEKLFDAVVMAPVTKHPDLRKIQDEIAYGLGLELPAGIGDRSTVVRLKERFLKMRKVLVILDDIWDRLDLEAVGIPFEDQQKKIVETSSSSAKDQMKCKILLSSRELNVLSNKMGTQKEVAVGQLEDQEAWQMFKKIVGDRAESSELQPTGIDIVQNCGGLPIAIAALAEALKNKSLYEWRSALQKLRNPSPSNSTGIYAGVHTAIEVSYSHLGSTELKQAFLLSSLMGRNVSIQDLLKYGLGLGVFSQAYTIEEARDEVLTLISNLKASSLLMDGSNSQRFGMHDVIRKVAISIGRRDRDVLFVAGDHVSKEWSDKEAMKDFKWISLEYDNVNELPDELESPQLTLFYLFNGGPSLGIPANFFRGVQRLKVLDLTGVHMSPMPPSICLLKDLHTLCLDHSFLGDIAFIGELKNLEILSLLKSDLEKLPREIGQLTKLKLLDLSNCTKLKVIPSGVLACLSRLEELYLGNSFDRWEHEEHENQENASFAELKHLQELTALEVRIPDAQMIPTGLFSGKLTRYKIFFGDAWNNWTSSFESSRVVKLQLKACINFDYSTKGLLKMTEELHLDELNGVKNVVDVFNSEGFKDLKYLYVHNAAEVQQIIKSEEGVPFNVFASLEGLFLHNLIKLENIFQGWFKETAFNKLRVITVENCDQLKNLFSFSVAKQLLQLQHITVKDCSNMEEIVDNEEEGSGNAIVEATEGVQWKFRGLLRSLRLQNLAKLTHFNGSCKGMMLFKDQVAFPNLEELHLSWINVNKIWQASITPSSMENLAKLIIEGCHNLEYLFSFSMIRCLVKLGHLEIKECKRMGEIIVRDNVQEKEKMILTQLNILLMKDLQNLVRFYSGNCVVEFPSLKQLDIRNCPKFRGFTVKSASTDAEIDIEPLFNEQVVFLSLERITITHLKNFTTIWQDQLHVDSFCKLKSLEVRFCEKLMTILPSNKTLGYLWTSLEELIIVGCRSVEAIFKIGEFNATRTLVATDTQLRALHIENQPRLKHVWDKDPKRILTFDNLESVFVNSCKSLNHLFPTSVAKDLSRLQRLVISNSGLEEIVAIGAGMTEAVVKFEFPQVLVLVLQNRTRLRYFYPEKQIIKWPMLKTFYYFDCGEVKKRNGKEQDYQLDFPVQQPLFCMQKVIPQLEELSLSEDDILMLCGECQFKQNLFFNIKLLSIQNYFDDESDGLPIRFLHRFTSLEKLVFIECHLTELFPSKEDQVEEQEKHVETLSRIRELELHHIETLRHISTSKTASFQNLTNLCVKECHSSLITLLSVSIAQSLVQLERMIVTKCDSLSKIVGSKGDGIEDSIINFSKLRFLKLGCLPRLEGFCSGNFILKFPSLEKVIVYQCPRLKIFNEGDLNTPLLQKVELVEGEDKWLWVGGLNTTIQRMYEEKVGFAGLRDLILSDYPELMEIWHIKSPQEISLDWRLLRGLQIYDCSNFTYLLTPSMVRCLVQLITIEVKSCVKMEQVIMGDEESKMIFPQLHFITLQSCSNLTTFYKGSHNLEFPALIDITVKDSPKMVTFTSTSFREHEKEASQYFFTSKVEIHTLEVLTLSSINIQQVWQSQLSSISSFAQNLRRMIVTNCGNLRHLFTSSMVKSFAHLKVLKIQGCKLMDVVILIEGSEKKESMCQTVFPELEILVLKDLPQLIRFCSNNDSLGEISESQGLYGSGSSQLLPAMQTTLVKTEDTKIVFPLVTHLELEVLPKFKSFFTKTHIIKWPSLERILVCSCEVIQIFASELSRIEITHADNQLASRTQHPLFWISKDSFPCLEELKLGSNDSMKEIWHGEYPGDYFPKLQHIQLIQFPECSALLPSFFFQSLPNLEKLAVSETSFHEIFQCERLDSEDRHANATSRLSELKLSKHNELMHLWREESDLKPIFYNLRTLEVLECSKLMNLVPSIVSFENLQSLEVSRCHGLKNLVRYSTAKSLVQLTKMSIIYCDLVEEIVVCLEDDVKDGIFFSQLKYLQLRGLPRLGSFCSGKSKFEFPFLNEVIVIDCPNMQIFSSGELSTPKLQRIKLIGDEDHKGVQLEGNLNFTIQHFIQKLQSDHDFEKHNADGSE